MRILEKKKDLFLKKETLNSVVIIMMHLMGGSLQNKHSRIQTHSLLLNASPSRASMMMAILM